MNNSYTPISLVRDFHKTPHLDESLSLVYHEFYITTNSIWNSYSMSLFTLPIIISGTIGFIVLIIYFILYLQSSNICQRRKYVSNHGVINETSGHRLNTTLNHGGRNKPSSSIMNSSLLVTPHITINSLNDTRRSWTPSIKKLTIAVSFFVIIALISNNTIFFGNNYVVDGVNIMNKSLHNMKFTAESLQLDGDILINYGLTLGSLINQSIESCPEAASLTSFIDTYNYYIDEYDSYVNPVPSAISKAISDTDNYGVYLKNILIWSTYGFFYFLILFSFICIYPQKKYVMQSSIGVNGIFVFTFFALGSFIMGSLIGLSDFCMSPFSNFLITISESANYELASYYATCQGENILASTTNAAQVQINDLSSSISYLLSSNCSGNVFLLQAQGNISSVQSTLENVEIFSVCRPINNEIYNLLGEGLCDNNFRGIYIIWLWIYVTSSILLILTITITIIHTYFGRFWNNEEEDHHSVLYDGDDEYATYSNPDKSDSYVVNPATILNQIYDSRTGRQFSQHSNHMLSRIDSDDDMI